MTDPIRPAALLVLLSMLGGRAEAGGDLVLRHARIVDADGAREADAIVIRDGWITSIGPLPPDAAELEAIDLAGATVMPGLIDAHVHLSMVPGGGLREDTPEQTEALRREHLRAYVACGVTTVVDTGILPENAAHIVRWIDEGATAPRVRWVGPIFSPDRGYVASVIPEFPTVATPQDVREQLDAFLPLDPIGAKLTFERGFISPVWPLYADEVRDAIVAETDAHDLPRYVHALSLREYRAALEAQPSVFVHPVENGARRIAPELVTRGIYVMSTLSNADVFRMEFHPEEMDELPWSLTVPARERETGLDKKAIMAFHVKLVRMLMPHGALLYPIVLTAIEAPSTQRSRLRGLQRQVRHLHEAGVPIVLGTDSGSWPVFPWAFHGPTSIRELELLVEAGLSPQEAIAAGTSTAARMIGLEAEIGRVAVGLRADLILLGGDPLVDVAALRTPTQVIQDGVARTPAEWMAGP